MIEIIYITISLLVGYFIGRELLSIQTKQLKAQNEGLTEQVMFLQNKSEDCETALNKTTADLDKEKDIHQQVRKQLFAERDAGEDTINRLYERINGYKDELSKLTQENKDLRYRSVS